jgi:16S rRNA (cytidine1402-2'-O)-methyltransferase
VGRRRQTSQENASTAAPFAPSPGDPFDQPESRREDAGQSFAPGLYITATPIGNAADITLRALNLLKHCDAIVAEDTRVTSRLLSIHGISRPLFCYNDYNALSMRPKLLAKLKAGAVLALVSDAGTPLVSDPGYKLVRAARAEGIAVYPLPGASAALAALTIAGLPSDRFFFAGFLPAKAAARRAKLSDLRAVPATLIFFEAPQRLAESLTDMAQLLGAREAAVTRELTKLHEELHAGTLAELAQHYASRPQPKGEITLVVGPPAQSEPDAARIDHLLELALPFMPIKAASELVAEATSAPRRAVYLRALALKDEAEP